MGKGNKERCNTQKDATHRKTQQRKKQQINVQWKARSNKK